MRHGRGEDSAASCRPSGRGVDGGECPSLAAGRDLFLAVSDRWLPGASGCSGGLLRCSVPGGPGVSPLASSLPCGQDSPGLPSLRGWDSSQF